MEGTGRGILPNAQKSCDDLKHKMCINRAGAVVSYSRYYVFNYVRVSASNLLIRLRESGIHFCDFD
jgi:hypothetical protein